ncbi:hypothetical protein C8Q73DRAFT_794164 [Cubamyces lactineus]|nr:hypothetical protein C8Q73DRAFT_794164 [Cubamyces lactineus]
MAATAQTPLCMDIITNIFDHLIPDFKIEPLLPTFPLEQIESKLCVQALAASARVCRAFEGPSLDRLWAVVNNLKTLLDILPSYSATNGTPKTLYIGDDHWIRFRAYSSRVKKLNAIRDRCDIPPPGFSDHREIQDPIWTVLLHQSSVSPLFPLLTHLAVEGDLAKLMVLLCPTVTQLHLVPSYGSEGILRSQAIELVRPHLSHVRDIWISDTMTRKDDLCDQLGLSTLTHVRSITIDVAISATPALISAFMSFPHLRRLHLDCTFLASNLASLAELKSECGFFELRELHLIADCGTIVKFLEATDPPRLHRFGCTLPLSTAAGDDPLEDGVRAIVARLPPTLRCFHLRLSQKSTRYATLFQAQAEAQVLSPSASLCLPAELRALEEIREVDVSVEQLAIPFADGDLRALCEAWPHLTRFSFEHSQQGMSLWQPLQPESDSRPRDIPYPTLSSVLAFTEAHPDLVELTLPGLDTTTLRADELGTFGPGGLKALSPHPLRAFRLSTVEGDMPIIQLATVLDRAFPELDLDAIAAVSLRMLGRVMQAPQASQNHYRGHTTEDTSFRLDGPYLLAMLLSTLRAARGYNGWGHQ